MLTIQNIEKLRGSHMGGWEVTDVESAGPVSYLKAYHYNIILKRNGKAAAVLIDRNENRLLKQYHMYICWEQFDNILYEAALSKESISKKDTFFGMVIHHLNEEYNKR
jgi:hypothetical protein